MLMRFLSSEAGYGPITKTQSVDLKGWVLDFALAEDAQLFAVIAETSQTHSEDPVLNGAIGELYDRYGRLVYSVAIHVVGDTETAEEITQDVFARACDAASTYKPEMTKVSSWLASITRHRANDELRRRNARPEKNNVDWPEEGDPSNLDAKLTENGLEEGVENNLQNHNLHQIIASLPTDQRQALTLAYFYGLSHSEIASLLGEPLGTVKSRIRMAMQKLRDTMIESGMMYR
jgi:RNA polymerase sigma-70 factor, ECF subfamily